MIARMLVYRNVTCVALVIWVSVVHIGCTNSDSKAEPETGAYLASGGLAQAEPSQPVAPDASASQPPSVIASPHETRQDMSQDRSDQMDSDDAPVEPDETSGDATLFSISSEDPPPTTQTSLPQLRADLPPAKLIEFLDGADRDMQLIVTGQSGITDAQRARNTLIHFMKMKLEASRRLLTHPDADANAKSEGERGELQSLSHLAAVGDLKAAVELEELANANLKSDNARLVADSRLVLMGFAIESLQNGKDDAADRIVSYVDAIKQSEIKPDVPAMMVMGQARETLANYGHQEKARLVRDTIIELFANSPDPKIAQLAGQLAGNVHFDAVEKLRARAIDGETVSTSQWREAVEKLIDESADMQTVKYLAGAALELESRGLSELVSTTLDVASDRFSDEESATGREVQLAIRASEARADVIGRVFDPEPAEGDDSDIRLADYRGKVVLIPFWAMGFPESLQLVARLRSIHDANPDKTAIVGLNLDTADERLDQFVEENELSFPHIRAQSSATDVATQFGLVSFPFVAILDQKGHVAAINFTGYELEKTVQELVQQ